MSRIERETKETTITLDVRVGEGPVEVATGDTFLDHMLTTLARYAGLQLSVTATGDLRHHLVEGRRDRPRARSLGGGPSEH